MSIQVKYTPIHPGRPLKDWNGLPLKAGDVRTVNEQQARELLALALDERGKIVPVRASWAPNNKAAERIVKTLRDELTKNENEKPKPDDSKDTEG